MTPEEHNKALGICHLVYGGLYTLLMLAMGFMFWAFFNAIPEGGPPTGVIMIFLTLFMALSFIFTLPSFIAGYAMLRHKPWARTASIIAAVIEALSVPLGTAVCVYSFWFMFSDAGKAMYDKNSARPERPYALHDWPPHSSASEWNTQQARQQQREREYVPPTQPPNWRDE